ncbi:hypothetical protein T265_15498, partial [Opisthorchis viverrini]
MQSMARAICRHQPPGERVYHFRWSGSKVVNGTQLRKWHDTPEVWPRRPAAEAGSKEHVPGKENQPADWLSRPEAEDEVLKIMIGANGQVVELGPGKLVQIQRQDPVLQKVAAALLD